MRAHISAPSDCIVIAYCIQDQNVFAALARENAERARADSLAGALSIAQSILASYTASQESTIEHSIGIRLVLAPAGFTFLASWRASTQFAP